MALTTDEMRTFRDLNYIARKKLPLSQYDIDRLYAMNQEVLVGRPTDPDVGYLLGLMASTDDGRYWKDLIDKYAAWLAESPTPAPSPSPTPTPTPVPVPVTGDFAAQVLAVLAGKGIYVAQNQLGIGGLNPDAAAGLHVFGNQFLGDASIHMQHSTTGDVSTRSLSGDGGTRELHNQMLTKVAVPAVDPDDGTPYMNNLRVVKPNKISSQIGIDSRHQFSISRTVPPGDSEYRGPHEYTQDVVLVIYEAQKVVAWESWRRGWTWKLGVDAKFGPGRWWQALFG